MEIVGIIAAVAGIVGAAAAVIAVLPHSGKPQSPPVASDASSLTLEEIVVHNGPAEVTTAGEAARLAGGRQTLASSPTIDLTVLNRGTRRALVTGVRIRILDSAKLPVCYSQGGGPVPVSARYTITLPADPLPSQATIHRALHQQIPADDVDRFIFRFGARDVDQDADQLFALHVQLTVSGGGTIDAGRFVLALAGAFSPTGGAFPIGDAMPPGPQRDAWLALAPSWCYRQNLEAAQRLLGAPGRRSNEMAAIGPITPMAMWLRDRDATPPRAAATKLLDSDSNSDIRLALFAAEKTGDRAFVNRIHTAAASRLVEIGKAALDDGWLDGAIDAAQASLQIRETPEARTLLAQGRTRQKNQRH
ncbi:MAG TPA: hypothetical protein VFY45_27240 [Baekduia sp.]|nr:hypothetical protein [Baekduia sp.]